MVKQGRRNGGDGRQHALRHHGLAVDDSCDAMIRGNGVILSLTTARPRYARLLRAVARYSRRRIFGQLRRLQDFGGGFFFFSFLPLLAFLSSSSSQST
jgi:hypothetical protein